MAEDFTNRTYKAGGFLLILSGVIGAIVSLGLLVSSGTGGLTIAGVALTPVATAILAALILVFSVIEFLGGWHSYKGENWYGCMTAAVLGMVTIFTIPLDLVAVILIALGEGEFDAEE
ncbi:MAG: hypothetical protein ABEK59_03245 [Halobacteria archaeon]